MFVLSKKSAVLDWDLIKLLLIRQRMPVTEFALKCGVTLRDISIFERGHAVESGTAAKVAHILGVRLDDITSSPLTRAFSARYKSAFISYGGPDEAFARLLFNMLLNRGCRAFFFPESAIPGNRLHKTMLEGVMEYDRVLLVCSRESLLRPGVLNEVEQVLVREAKEGGSEILIPITIDDFLFKEWSPSRAYLATQIRARVVADFRAANTAGTEFELQFEKLIRALIQPVEPSFEQPVHRQEVYEVIGSPESHSEKELGE